MQKVKELEEKGIEAKTHRFTVTAGLVYADSSHMVGCQTLFLAA